MKLPKLTLPFQKKKPEENDHDKAGVDQQAAPPPQQALIQGLVSIQDIIAPEAIEVDFNYLKIGNLFTQTLFVAGYPRFVSANWLAPLINFNHSLDISMHIIPVDGKSIMDDLRRKITEMEAEIQGDLRRGRIANIDTQVKLEDARGLQEQLAKGAERFYQFGLYITINASSIEELYTISKQVQSALGALLIISKKSTLQMEEGFKTTLPQGQDQLKIHRNMDTTSLATTFPFTSSDLTSDEGILYGINEHNDSLVIFDRFSLENANMVVFAKSGAGKSYAVKLEALRSLMFNTEVIIIDPEGEYVRMAEAVGGDYIDFSFNSEVKINPFDLSALNDSDENELGLKIISLHALLKIMLGDVTANEEATLDRALVQAYKAKGITPDPTSQKNEPPLMEDLYKALIGMESSEAKGLANRLEKYIKGSFRGIFDQQSNVQLNSNFTVFGIKDMENALRPIAMFLILDFIWTRVKRQLKKRLLIVDEAWYLMQYPDSANFLFGLAKRARKYFLGVTTISQDVEDFLGTDQGKAIVTNSSIQFLMKQSTAAIDSITKSFHLSDGEKRLLLSAEVGEGLFFAGQNHVALRVVASQEEDALITSNPREVMAQNASRSPASTGNAAPQVSNDNYQPASTSQVTTGEAGQLSGSRDLVQPAQAPSPSPTVLVNTGSTSSQPATTPIVEEQSFTATEVDSRASSTESGDGQQASNSQDSPTSGTISLS